MNFFEYIKSRIIPVLLVVLALCAVGLLLWVLSYSIQVVTVLMAVLLCAFAAALLWDYLARRRFYTDLKDALFSKNETLYLSELISEPSFYEGQLSYQALEKATKEMNDKVAQYRHAAEEYQEYIETWIHEIKTPIAALSLSLSNIEDPSISQSLEHDVGRIETYVEQALYYARSSAVEKDYIIKQVKLDELVKTVVKKNSQSLIEHNMNPHFEGLDVVVYSDTKWLEFILGQLVANAIKYQKPQTDAETSCITFSAERHAAGFEAQALTLSVCDNGIGISQADLGRIFEKGFTGANGRRRAHSTGIGLYLCKKLCEKLKIKISADSVEGKYCKISLEFPLSKMYFLD